MVNITGIVVEALVISSLYALVAIGFTMIFGVAGQLNLGHGASVVIASMGTVSLMNLGINFVPAIVLAVALAGVFNAILFGVFVKALEREYDRLETQAIMVMIVTLLLFLIVEQFFRLSMGSQPYTVPPLIAGSTDIVGISVTNNLVLAFIVSWVAIAALYGFVSHTWTGRALLATTMSRRGATIIGVDIDRLYLVTWAVAGLLAGFSGLFIGSFETAVYTMGRDPLVISFAIVVLGGLGSIKGSVIGAYIIGTIEVITTSLISTRLSGMAAFTVLIVVLMAKPQGLFGRELTLGD